MLLGLRVSSHQGMSAVLRSEGAHASGEVNVGALLVLTLKGVVFGRLHPKLEPECPGFAREEPSTQSLTGSHRLTGEAASGFWLL